MLRVTSGTLRGFKLDVPNVEAVRPPLEMARQAVFNILGQDMEGLRVLDIFAGSGIMGIEAMSRGAASALFVEKDRAAVACMMRNLEKTKTLDCARVITADAYQPKRFLKAGDEFDLVFLDPPFAVFADAESRARLNTLVDALLSSPSLAPGATVILRMPRAAHLEPLASLAAVDDDRSYGHSRILFLRRAAPPGEASTDATQGDGGR